MWFCSFLLDSGSFQSLKKYNFLGGGDRDIAGYLVHIIRILSRTLLQSEIPP